MKTSTNPLLNVRFRLSCLCLLFCLGTLSVLASTAPELAVSAATALTTGNRMSCGIAVVNAPAATQALTLRNTGNDVLSGLALSIDGANAGDFSVSPLASTSMTPGGDQSIIVSFSPKGSGPRAAVLHIASNDPNHSPFDFGLFGQGIAFNLRFGEAGGERVTRPQQLIDFGTVELGGNPERSFTISNPSSQAISGLRLEPQFEASWLSSDPSSFTITPALPDTLGAGESFTFTVRFTGLIAGARRGTFRLRTDDPFETLATTETLTFTVYLNAPRLVVGSPSSAYFGHPTSGKTVLAWGRNDYNQTSVPYELSDVMAVAAGGFHSVALKQDGTVVAWGVNNNGQTDVPKGLSGVVAIAAGFDHTVALKQDGTVVGWGWLYPVSNLASGMLYVPAGLRGVEAIATGFMETVALKQDGSVVTWGVNSQYPSFVPKGVTDVISVAAGTYGKYALKQDGTVIGWIGAAAVPDGLRGVHAISAGRAHTLAVVETPGDFGEERLGSQREHLLSLINRGTEPLLITRAEIVGLDADQFSIVAPVPASITPSDFSQLSYQMIPTRLGPLHAALKITSNDPTTPVYTLDLIGSGVYGSNNATKPGVKDSSLTYDPPVADRTTGAILQKVTFINTTGFALNGLRLVVSNVTPGITVQSSSATNKVGTVEVIYSKSIAVGEATSLTLTYNDPQRRTNLQPSIHAESLAEPEPRDGPVDGELVSTVNVRDSVNGPLLEWISVAHKTYVVEYSDDAGKTWYSAVHRLLASSTRLFWTDRGQPETWTKPSSKAARMYRVKKVL